MELAEQTIEEIRHLTFDPDAQIITAMDSIGTVYWSDETPKEAFDLFYTVAETAQIRRLLVIRARYWNTGTMAYEDQQYWQDSKRQFPDWPVFQRLELSVEQREKQQTAEKTGQILIDVVMSLADETEVWTEGGIEYHRAVFKRESFLKEPRRRKWWQFWR